MTRGSRGPARIGHPPRASNPASGGARQGGASPIEPADDEEPRRAAAPAGPDPGEAEAIARARGGDHDAFRVLVERYQGRVHRLALRVLRDEEKARDAVQESFLKVYRSLGRFEGRSGFYTWLYRLVLNVCLDMRRRDRSHREVEWTPAHGEAGSPGPGVPSAWGAGAGEDVGGDPAAAVERAQLRARVAAAIERLPDVQRETLILREVEGLSYAEIAEALSISKGTVMSRLHYARKRVQQLLEGEEA